MNHLSVYSHGHYYFSIDIVAYYITMWFWILISKFGVLKVWTSKVLELLFFGWALKGEDGITISLRVLSRTVLLNDDQGDIRGGNGDEEHEDEE
jgi:hypothetical protein